MFRIDVFSEVWNRQCARIVLAIRRLWWRSCHGGAWGRGGGCVCSLIIMKRQTSLALRILYCDVWPLCLATNRADPLPPISCPAPYTRGTTPLKLGGSSLFDCSPFETWKEPLMRLCSLLLSSQTMSVKKQTFKSLSKGRARGFVWLYGIIEAPQRE